MSTLFISDLHLSPATPQMLTLFDYFIDHYMSAEVEALYILGDLFDAWIGDDFNQPYSNQVMAQLKKVSDKCPIYFVHGNRDFLIGDNFSQQTGIQLLPDHSTINVNDEKVLIMHGDTLCTDDIAYIQFRSQVRNPEWQQALLSLSIEDRLAKAQAIRDNSKNAMADKEDFIMDVNQNAVKDRLQEYACHTLIHGHTHRPAIHEFKLDEQMAKRIVLSDWKKNQGNFLRCDDKGMQLHYFNLQGLTTMP